MTVCCAGTLEFVESLVEDVYIRHSLLPFNEMAQGHRTCGLGVQHVFYLTVVKECKMKKVGERN